MANSVLEQGTRSAGVLLHPTSLPSPFGIGDLGPSAYTWVDLLARYDQTWWQTLPLGPTGFGDSPYQSFSAFAGNPLLISPEKLHADGLIQNGDLNYSAGETTRIDYGAVYNFKIGLLQRAWQNFRAGRTTALKPEFEQFLAEESAWLDSFALFMALRDAHHGALWTTWPAELVRREPAALAKARREHADSIAQHQFRQFLFFRQWRQLRAYANENGIRLFGDAPIFVSLDSSDVWASPECFLLDAQRRPTVIAGVPPDYFSPTGQLWGNPLYNWDKLKETGYRWWIDRLRAALSCVDLLRLDHFRGFAAAWHVPAGAETAEGGKWVPGPGADFFARVREELGGLPLVAEDLGEITPDVHELRDQFQLPGMRVLQFAWEGKPENPFLPHMHNPVDVVYTATHDNDTTLGWYNHIPGHEKEFLWRYLDRPAREGAEFVWDFIRLAWSSVARIAIIPLQDLLALDSSGRMNFPGKPEGNWGWRFRWDMPVEEGLARLNDLTWLYNRLPAEPAKEEEEGAVDA